jgi:hypothetical protein
MLSSAPESSRAIETDPGLPVKASLLLSGSAPPIDALASRLPRVGLQLVVL